MSPFRQEDGKLIRKCLKCDQEFMSEHKFNRLCKTCARSHTQFCEWPQKTFGGHKR